MDWFKEFPQSQFLELVSNGRTELQALELVNEERAESKRFDKAVLVQLQLKSPKFRTELEEAKRTRADVWFSRIAASSERVIEKDEVPGEKLKFEQRKYLAAIDNPEKYSEKVKHELDVKINIFQEMKDLKASDVKRIMTSCDPFSAEFKVVEEVEPESIEELLE